MLRSDLPRPWVDRDLINSRPLVRRRPYALTIRTNWPLGWTVQSPSNSPEVEKR